MNDPHNDASIPPEPQSTPDGPDREPGAPRQGSAQDGPPAGEPGQGDPAPGGEDAPRKRRRRRGGRGRRGRSAGDAAQAPGQDPSNPDLSDSAQDSPHEGGESSSDENSDDAGDAPGPARPAQPQGAPGEDGQRRRRRRRGKGRGQGSENPQAEGSPASGPGRDHSPSAHDEDSTDPDQPEPRPRRERAKLERSNEHWEEIFEGSSFAELGLRNSVLKGIEAAGFTNPTKIQSELIPLVIAGKDVLGQSRTGTGKTAAFGLPLYHIAQREMPFQSLILAPTRELAIQIAAELADLGKFTPVRISAVYGGQNVGAQARQLDKGPEIIVATPGRLMDMVERGHVHLRNVRVAILDEVDRMLDIGFRDDIKRILSSIKQAHQTVFVSATISDEIEKLARTFMKDPVKLVTTGGSLTVSLVEQHYIAVQPWDKRAMLAHILRHEEPDLTVVFCRMKRTVDDLAKYLQGKNIDAHAIHGDMYQGKRNSVMRRLRAGELGVLVASDLAARGLDVEGISHVVNYDLPEDPEVYIHRIGRTARAGRRGVAWSLVTPEQGDLLTAIEKLANIHIPEKTYPDFKPGPVPSDIRARREADDVRTEAKKSVSRAAPPPVPAPTVVDATKFPGGIVPSMLPPKRLGGRVKTTRGMKSAAAFTPAPPAAGPAAPAPQPPAEDS
ncbi:MAG: DEAD/DEAH box helicase [Planctomycetota bacterium]|nr:DEAD/DEAH box helicase [Planctomycetota bacterium]